MRIIKNRSKIINSIDVRIKCSFYIDNCKVNMYFIFYITKKHKYFILKLPP